MTPADFLFALLVHEAPVIAQKPTLEASWRPEMAAAIELDRKVGSAGALVSPEVDAALLDAARWYEARERSHPKDGDCHFVAVKGTREFKTVCDAFGPLQVTLPAFRAVLGTPDGRLAGLPEPEFYSRGVLPPEAPGTAGTSPPAAARGRFAPKPEDLREPETGVRAGYAGLLRWKGLCGGTPARWLTAWGWGKCPKEKTTLDFEAVRRCELTTVLLIQRGQLPEGWKCGHETRKIRDPHDQHLLAWAREHAKGESHGE